MITNKYNPIRDNDVNDCQNRTYLSILFINVFNKIIVLKIILKTKKLTNKPDLII